MKSTIIQTLKKTINRAFLSAMFAFSANAMAGGVESLHGFYANTQSMQASFHQVVSDMQGRKIQEVDGNMQLQRPGKFRWDYNKPYVQQIIGDGRFVWLFDPEMNQVTQKSVQGAIGSTPAALLAGTKEIEKAFTLSDDPRKSELQWVLATPKDKDAGFEKVSLGFKDNLLRQMELYDNFGHITQITFGDLKKNAAIPAKNFEFTPPPNADVIRD